MGSREHDPQGGVNGLYLTYAPTPVHCLIPAAGLLVCIGTTGNKRFDLFANFKRRAKTSNTTTGVSHVLREVNVPRLIRSLIDSCRESGQRVCIFSGVSTSTSDDWTANNQ